MNDMAQQTRQLAALVVENLDQMDLSSVPQPDRRDIETLVRNIRHERTNEDMHSLARFANQLQGIVLV